MKDQTYQLFNPLPAYLRNMTKCKVDEFEEKLDKFLERIPDEPSVRGLTPSNGIVDLVKRPGLRIKLI